MNWILGIIKWILSFFTKHQDQTIIQTGKPFNLKKYKLTSEGWARKKAGQRANAERRTIKVYRMSDRSLRFRSKQTTPPLGGIFLFNVRPRGD